jgi:hypothetical protein
MQNNLNNPSQINNPQTTNKTVISDTETTHLRLEVVEYVRAKLDIAQIASVDFQDFERDIVIAGLLEGLVNLKNRSETDSSRRISRIILAIIEQNYEILASKHNKYLKLRDLSWDKVFGIIPEIRILLKGKPAMMNDIIVFIGKVKEKCPFPYQYYWILHTKSKDPRAKLIPEEIFLFSYLQDYVKAMNKNTKELSDHYKQGEKDKEIKKGMFGLRAAIKSVFE